MSKQKKQKLSTTNTRVVEEVLKYELLGICLLAVGVFVAVSLYTTRVGAVGGFVSRVFSTLFGKGAILITLYMGWLGLKYIIGRNPVTLSVRALAVVFQGLLFLGMTHLYVLGFNFIWDTETLKLGGGIIGYGIVFLLSKAFGTIGTYVLLTASTICCLVIITKVSMAKILEYFSMQFRSFCERLKNEIVQYVNSLDEEEEGLEELPEPRSVSKEEEKTTHKITIYPQAWNDSLNEADENNCQTVTKEIVDHTEMFIDSEHNNKEELDSNDLEDKDASSSEKHNDKKPVVDSPYPPFSLLTQPVKVKNTRLKKNITDNIQVLEETLANFGVRAKVTQVSTGPAITRYEIQPSPGVKVSRIVNLADDLALNMAATDVRIEAPIPGKAAVGIEVPNSQISSVFLREILESDEFIHSESKLSVALGKDIAGGPVVADLTKMPHLLIAGSTGSGKSVCMNAVIASVLFKAKPNEVKLLMIDPKMVELSNYNGIPHLISPVVTDAKKSASALRWAVREMETRYNLFAASGTKNLESYNKLMIEKGEEPLPLVLILIDELADLMMVAPSDVEDAICRLAQMARAAGIHLVIATQRPSVDVITGLIKANVPSRIAFAVSSQVDSRTILDMAGAEKLLGKGDMLYYPIGYNKPVRVQGVYVSDKDIDNVVTYLKETAKPEYQEGIFKEDEQKTMKEAEIVDELLSEAVRLTIESGQASISMLQRRLRIGYTRAARLMDTMEEHGVVGSYEGSKPRSVKMTIEQWEQAFNGQQQSASTGTLKGQGENNNDDM